MRLEQLLAENWCGGVNVAVGRRYCFFFFQAEDGIRDYKVTGVQTCALPICEEFVLLLMRTTPQEAERVAQRIRAQLSADGYVLAAGQRGAISFGIAPAAANTPLTHALTRADGLLYEDGRAACREREEISVVAA